jgi:hypothetical protein
MILNLFSILFCLISSVFSQNQNGVWHIFSDGKLERILTDTTDVVIGNRICSLKNGKIVFHLDSHDVTYGENIISISTDGYYTFGLDKNGDFYRFTLKENSIEHEIVMNNVKHQASSIFRTIALVDNKCFEFSKTDNEPKTFTLDEIGEVSEILSSEYNIIVIGSKKIMILEKDKNPEFIEVPIDIENIRIENEIYFKENQYYYSLKDGEKNFNQVADHDHCILKHDQSFAFYDLLNEELFYRGKKIGEGFNLIKAVSLKCVAKSSKIEIMTCDNY